MGEIKFQRHDILFISRKDEIEFLRQSIIYPSNDVLPTANLYFQSENNKIPFVVRRNDKDSIPGKIAVGVSLPVRAGNARIRLSGFINKSSIVNIINPYGLDRFIDSQSEISNMVKWFCKEAKKEDIQIGFFGSLAMELITGKQYRDKNSDIDILIRCMNLKKIRKYMEKCFLKYPNITIDGEVILANGFGVKIKELLSESSYMIAKGLDKVLLLKRKEVLNLLIG